MVAVEVNVADGDIDAPRKLLLVVGVPCGSEDENHLLASRYIREQDAKLSILRLQGERVVIRELIVVVRWTLQARSPNPEADCLSVSRYW